MMWGSGGNILLISQAADECGVKTWVVKGLADRIEVTRRVGRFRAIAREDMPKIRLGLKAMGYDVPLEPPIEVPVSIEAPVGS
jgi:hypothetical protein